jgi:hypothetical protein
MAPAICEIGRKAYSRENHAAQNRSFVSEKYLSAHSEE